ncbi:phytanoyl-CoA dioxygenase family protein [Pelagibius sp. Alg239-R121]|uniref:phytanoyl-CoA dioxygenase family protein n=1 Tax=Pelagibius sp. Alg239-R121 TaxID=2993448 RepID=UPI0024A6A830|nr:phytanoyl-CoA dioxygenase family protein [Pelagibius sp. Alg239-R121]
MDLNTDHVLADLRRDGISVHEGYIAGGLLDELSEEFERYLAQEEEGVMHVEHTPGKAFRIVLDDPSLRELNLKKSCIASAFFNDPMKELASAYLPGAPFCNGLLGTNEFRAMPVTEVHFDTLQCLKFMIYLDDTTAANGAFSFIPGSHRKTHAYRKWFARLGGVPSLIPNALPDEHRARVTSIEAKAGTLIVFDTDGLHAGGVLKPGTTRRVVRAHCMARSFDPWKLTELMPYRIKHSGLNPATIYSKVFAPSYRATQGTGRAQGTT